MFDQGFQSTAARVDFSSFRGNHITRSTHLHHDGQFWSLTLRYARGDLTHTSFCMASPHTYLGSMEFPEAPRANYDLLYQVSQQSLDKRQENRIP